MTRLAVVLFAWLLPLVAQAEKLRVDVLIFSNPVNAEERGTAPRHPDDESATGIDDLRGLAYAGIALMPEDASQLASEWQALKKSGRHALLLRLSWLQEMPRAQHGPALRIYLPGGDGIGSFGGWLRLHGGDRLGLSADLEIVKTGADGQAVAFRMQERRGLLRDQLSYLDSPRIGLLVRVTGAR